MPVTGRRGCVSRPSVFQPRQQSANASVPSYCWQILPTNSWRIRVSVSWSLANASLAYFHAFEDTVKTEGDAALEQIGSYAGPHPFMGDSHLRPDGFGLLDTMLMPLTSPKYSHFNGSLEGPSYVEHFLVLFAVLASCWASHIKVPLSNVLMMIFPRLTPVASRHCLVAVPTVSPLARFLDLAVTILSSALGR